MSFFGVIGILSLLIVTVVFFVFVVLDIVNVIKGKPAKLTAFFFLGDGFLYIFIMVFSCILLVALVLLLIFCLYHLMQMIFV